MKTQEVLVDIEFEVGFVTVLKQDFYVLNQDMEVLPGVYSSFYSNGIGEIISEITFLSTSYDEIEKRLISYTIN